QDQQVIKTATTMRVLDIHPFAGGEWKVYIFTKAPMWNDQNELIGTIYHGQDITSTTAMEIGSLLTRASVAEVGSDILGQNSYILGTQFSDLKLTDRQSEVLFYLLRGKTVKQIGLLLGISYRTVDEYMEQLKHKFGAINRHELIDKAISFGFLNTIPEKLFRTQLSVELKDW
ncbi:MAG: helix-turn-helix transcriptional regulator, partial [Gammaproteobacteria bacterium]|nr:helix-turn-helix transcriptional regulator [Gammaproteobacteria bacterium]